MSEFVQGALVTGGLTLVAVLVTQLTNFLLEQRRDREWYRRTMFEKRLEALPVGKAWLNRLWDAMYSPYADGSDVPIREALEWYQQNLLSIHGEIPVTSPLGTFLYSTDTNLKAGAAFPDEEMWRKAEEFVRSEANALLAGSTP